MDVPELVIFDCDGVLVDSEPIAVEIDREVLRMVGIELSETEIVERFVGRSAAVMDAMIEEHLRGPIPQSLRQTFDRISGCVRCTLDGGRRHRACA
jgi:beta-phosphoglucomutase-like phosphatase (HAD superfamily)